MARDDDKKQEAFTLPEARLINSNLFTKDAYNKKATPSYKLEIAIDADSEEYADLEEAALDAADEYWGPGAGDDEDLVLPFISGDKLANKREKRGKPGDAYKGMIVIRANTIYNAEGVDGPGGIQVFDQDAERVEAARQGEIYNGCYGIAAVTWGFYEDDDGNNAMKFYLSAFQKTGEGEKLITASDKSGMFKPVARADGSKGEGRRRRRARD